MKKKGLIISLVGVILIVAAVLTFILWPKKSNKEIYTDAIKNSLGLSKLTEKSDDFDKYEKILKEKIIKLTFEDNGVNVGDEDGTTRTFNENMEMYVGKENFYLTANSKVNEKLLEMNMILKDNKLYLFIKDIFSKYYYLDESFGEENNLKLNLNTEKIINYFEESLLEIIDNDKITTEKTDLTINSKKYSTKKYAYTFTGENLYKVVKLFLDKVKNDKELKSQLNSLLKDVNVEGQNIKLDDLFDIALNASEELKSLGNLFTHTIYLDGDDVISNVVSVSIDLGGQSLPIGLTINSVEGYKEIYILAMGQKLYDLVVKKVDDNNSSISLSMIGEEVVNGSITKTDKNVKFKLAGVGSAQDQLNIEASLDIISDYEVNGKIDFKSGESHATYSFKTEEVQEVPNVDVSNSAPIEEMTDGEKKALEELMKEFYPGFSMSLGDSEYEEI